MKENESERGIELEDKSPKDYKSDIIERLKALRASSQLPEEANVGEVVIDQAVGLTQRAIGHSACTEVIVCYTPGGILILNVITQTKPEERFSSSPSDSLRLSNTEQRGLAKIGIRYMSIADDNVQSEAFGGILKDYKATIIQRFTKPSRGGEN